VARDIPLRVRVAVALVDPAPDARVLEVGFGPGVSLDLLCRRVPDGHVTGIDRSGTAVARAERRNARHLAEARLDLIESDLAGYRPSGDPFDAVLAVNVNVFWTGPADTEIERLADLLADGGAVHLVHELPDAGAAERVTRRLRDNFGRHGFTVEVTRPEGLLCVTARPALEEPGG
jgi:trans-aconitate methyltransferase